MAADPTSLEGCIDLDELERFRAEAEKFDKMDLFLYYHENWPKVVAELKVFQDFQRRKLDIARKHLHDMNESAKEYYRNAGQWP